MKFTTPMIHICNFAIQIFSIFPSKYYHMLKCHSKHCHYDYAGILVLHLFSTSFIITQQCSNTFCPSIGYRLAGSTIWIEPFCVPPPPPGLVPSMFRYIMLFFTGNTAREALTVRVQNAMVAGDMYLVHY